jgi:hypothetical protein
VHPTKFQLIWPNGFREDFFLIGQPKKRTAFSTYYLRPNIGPIPNEKSYLFFPNLNTKFPNPASKTKVASETSACEILLILRQTRGSQEPVSFTWL